MARNLILELIMFASTSSSRMDLSHSTDTINLTNGNNIKFTMSTIIDDDDDDENIWDKIKVTKKKNFCFNKRLSIQYFSHFLILKIQ